MLTRWENRMALGFLKKKKKEFITSLNRDYGKDTSEADRSGILIGVLAQGFLQKSSLPSTRNRNSSTAPDFQNLAGTLCISLVITLGRALPPCIYVSVSFTRAHPNYRQEPCLILSRTHLLEHKVWHQANAH